MGAWLCLSASWAFVSEVLPKAGAVGELMFAMSPMELFAITIGQATAITAMYFLPVAAMFLILEFIIVKAKRIPARQPAWWRNLSKISVAAALAFATVFALNGGGFGAVLASIPLVYVGVKFSMLPFWAFVEGVFPQQNCK